MNKVGVAAILLLALGAAATLLFKSPDRTSRSRRGESRDAAKIRKLERQVSDLQKELSAREKERSSNGGFFDLAAKTTAEEENARNKTLAWLHGLDKRFRWLGSDQMRTLRELDLSRMTLDPKDLELLKNLPSLARVNLRGSTITDAGLAILGSITQLQSIELTGTIVSDAGLAHLAQLPALSELGLNNTAITDGGLAALAGVKTLKSIQLNNTKITNDGLANLTGLPIESIAIGATAVDDAGMEHLNAFKLKELSIYRNQNISDAGFRHIRNQPGLETLNMRGISVSADALADFKGLKNLRELNASIAMTDPGMVHLKHLTGMKRLHLYSNQGITDAGIVHIKDLKGIEALSLQFTGITDNGLSMLSGLPNLRVIDVRGTKVTPGGRDKFQAEHPDTKIWR